jgi:membrane-bound lytic murein transglycosylase D
MRIFAALFFAVTITAAAQTPQVPHKMSFAGMTLTIRDDARREIQKDVDALTQSPKHFNIKAERAKTYFPIIEKIFADENVPDDFKYLVLQESSLVPDAVSVSNAVGFWQFKDFTAMEMGLRVDREIDERMNIASSTRAAARYIKKNNTFFDNWIYALQAYQMGAGGVMRSEKETHSGATHAEITSGTYWYVKKFLAHKIAFEEGIKGKGLQEVTVYENKNRKTLAELSAELSVDEGALRTYNKWTKSGTIPDDRTYIVLIPGASGSSIESIPTTVIASQTSQPAQNPNKNEIKALLIEINGVKAIQALSGDNAAKIAARAGADLASFLKWNDISYSTQIIPGTFYFLGKKRAKAAEDFHTLVKGEDLWTVSQKYGVKLNKLKKYNRLNTDVIPPGTTLWLSSTKPRSSPNQVVVGEVVEVNDGETFNWSSIPEEKMVMLVTADSAQVVTPAIVVAETKSEPVVNQGDSVKTLQLTQEIEINQDSTSQIIIPVTTENKTEHVVQAKETLYAIAKMYNVGVMDLVNWNNLDLQQGIKIGQVLKLGAPELVVQAVSTPIELYHEVAASDTLYSIARKYGVTIKDLMDWNQKKDFSVSVGEKLKVKQGQ